MGRLVGGLVILTVYAQLLNPAAGAMSRREVESDIERKVALSTLAFAEGRFADAASTARYSTTHAVSIISTGSPFVSTRTISMAPAPDVCCDGH